jgi:hypothetical protein
VPNGLEPAPMSQKDFTKWFQEERERLARVAKKSRMTVDE